MDKFTLGAAEFDALARHMRRIEFFKPLTVAQLDSLLPYVMLLGWRSGETVFKQGDKGDAFYIVHEGKLDVRTRKGFLSFSKSIACLGPGSFFGEMSLLAGEPRSATVACLADSKLFALAAADFAFVLKQNPSLAAELARVASRRGFESSR